VIARTFVILMNTLEHFAQQQPKHYQTGIANRRIGARLQTWRLLMNDFIKAVAMKPWDVYVNGKWVNTVYYDLECNAEYVKESLINHDGYPVNIEVLQP